MELNEKERLVLINQYEILKFLDKDNVEMYNKAIGILEGGYKIFYENLTRRLHSEMDEESSKFVFDILNVYRLIESYKRQYPDDQEVINHRFSRFDGFDGNEEPEYLSFTEFLIEDLGRFDEQKQYQSLGWNSHSNRIEKYDRMITVWKGLNISLLSNNTFKHEDIMAVLDA